MDPPPPPPPPPFSGFVLDPSKCRDLSIAEKRELVHELSKWPESAPEKLQAWSRRDLLEILCAEMGKERKYTGLTKQKLIEHIFRIMSEKKSGKSVNDVDLSPHPPPSIPQTPAKRQRKTDHPLRLPIETSNHSGEHASEARTIRRCDNLVCRAALSPEDAFCKRCSCCICHKYDDNKDPSLWLLCQTEDRSQTGACGASCHIECLLKHERAGIVKNGQCLPLDGSFYCIHCGYTNDFLGFWRKQLMHAKDARRVDILCYRVSLCQRILQGTEKYRCLLDIVDTAVKKLEAEVGPFSGLPNMARGIVNRLSVGAEVQRLCANAVALLDSNFLTGASENPPVKKVPLLSSDFIRFEDISSTSLTLMLDLEDNAAIYQELLGYSLWHRKDDTNDYPTKTTGTIHKPKGKLLVTNLCPATEYYFRVIAFSKTSELGNWEVRVTTEAPMNEVPSNGSPKTNSSGISNPLVAGDESNNTSIDGCIGIEEKTETKDTEKAETPPNSGSGLDEDPISIINEPHRDSTTFAEQNQASDVPKSEDESNAPVGNEIVVVASLPVTPSRVEEANKPSPSDNVLDNGHSKPEDPGSSSKKRSCGEKCEDLSIRDGSSSIEGDYEYCVKVIRWLECKGHIETNFRVKFLTWFSLRASPQERRIVNVYVDTLLDDPGSLAGQLVDTFSEAVSSKRPPPVPTGFCMKLWH
ncbi:VIN3-like protein 2 [Iris pallida]|uniref:VIN3-like protein 2 n=1 Tax=Iris pallida TaxID=29817 RepID=A0AAX6FS12_IRIPA|nr:VIN3-like protein 2 [Iris pallida]